MSPEETDSDKRIVELLDEAVAELRTSKTVSSSTLQRCEAGLAPDLPELLETLRDLVSAAYTWRTGAGLGDLPCGEPETVDEFLQESNSRALPEQIGRYRVLERIAAGGMGAVYKAYDPELDRVVAIKVPKFDGRADMQTAVKQRFLREGRAAAQIRHAHVCPIYDVGEHDGIPFVVMAYVEGQSLSKRLRERGRFSQLPEAVEFVRQVADGLAAVHANGILHRDVKPGNILIDLAGQALLTDFGLALPVSEPDHLTATGIMVGTVAYMAPEQADAESGTIGPWTDLYGLGVVLYQMVTGRLPFEDSSRTLLSRISNETPPPPSKFRLDLDRALEAIINKSMTHEAKERYRSAPELAEALQRWLAGIASAPLATSDAGSIQAPSPVVVRSNLPDGSTVTVSVQQGANVPSKLSVTVSEQEFKKRQRRRFTIRVSLAFAVVFVVIGFYWWYWTGHLHDGLENGHPLVARQVKPDVQSDLYELKETMAVVVDQKRELVPQASSDTSKIWNRITVDNVIQKEGVILQITRMENGKIKMEFQSDTTQEYFLDWETMIYELTEQNRQIFRVQGNLAKIVDEANRLNERVKQIPARETKLLALAWTNIWDSPDYADGGLLATTDSSKLMSVYRETLAIRSKALLDEKVRQKKYGPPVKLVPQMTALVVADKGQDITYAVLVTGKKEEPKVQKEPVKTTGEAREAEAARKLKYAKQVLKDAGAHSGDERAGLFELAQKKLQEVTEKYAGSKAAKEAQDLLDKK
jgi:serine/threonine protein kinase